MGKYGVYSKDLGLVQEGDSLFITVGFKYNGVVASIKENYEVFLRFIDYNNELLLECSTLNNTVSWCEEGSVFKLRVSSSITEFWLGDVQIDLFVVSKKTLEQEHASELVPLGVDYRVLSPHNVPSYIPPEPPTELGDFSNDFNRDFYTQYI